MNATNAMNTPHAAHAADLNTARRGRVEADQMAVASFVLALPGLLVLNLVLGPIAITLAALALLRGTARRGRALLGLALGVTDLVLLAVSVVAGHGMLLQFGS